MGQSMRRYKASIVIPAYNEEKYLPKTLESISRQSWQNYELIIVDSESEDRTVEIAKSYGAKIVEAPRGNIGLCRKKGAEKASGDFIVSASADTVYDKEWLEKLISPIIDGKKATAGALRIYEPRPLEAAFTSVFVNCVVPLLYFVGFPYASADNLALEARFYKKIGGFRALPTAEEIDLLKRVVKAGKKVVYVKDAIAYVSPRRIRAWGAFHYLLFHTKNFLKYNVFGKVEKSYEPVR